MFSLRRFSGRFADDPADSFFGAAIEAAGGAAALTRMPNVVLLVVRVLAGWCGRMELQALREEDRFAALELAKAERTAAEAEDRRTLAEIRSGVATIRIAVVRLEGKVDVMKGKR